jgi:hypothetical protein
VFRGSTSFQPQLLDGFACLGPIEAILILGNLRTSPAG